MWKVINSFAPVVKWISQQSSELSLGVRVPPGAQSAGHFVQGGARWREPRSGKFLVKNYS